MGGTHVTDGIAYRLRVSPRARRVRIVIHRDGVEVVVPHGASSADAARFVQRSRAWIERHLAQIGSAPASSSPNPYADLPLFAALQPGELPARIETIPLRGPGREVPVHYIQAPMLRGRAVLGEPASRAGALVVYCLEPDSPPRDAVAALLKEWVREQAKTFFPGYIDALADEVGIPRPRDIRIGFQRTVWGSRSVSGRISLSATLLFLPPGLMRHVAVHELCHTLHMNHGRDFKRRLALHDPDASRNERDLKRADSWIPEWIRD